MLRNLFKASNKPPVLGRWSVDTATATTRAALANCDNCGTCTPYDSKQPTMLIVGDDIVDLRGAMLAGAYYLPGRPVSDKNMRDSL